MLVKTFRKTLPKHLFFFNKLLFSGASKVLQRDHFLYKFFLFFYKVKKVLQTNCCFYRIEEGRREAFTFNFFFRKKIFPYFLVLPGYKKYHFLKKIEKFQFFLINMLISSFKLLLMGFSMFPISFAALGAGILFASYNLAIARNPEEKDTLFGNTMMWFAFIETFVFIGLIVAGVSCMLIG